MKKHYLILMAFLHIGFFIYSQEQFTLPDYFRTNRNLPLIDIPTVMTVELSNFGAIPNDGKDDAIAIAKALNFCKKVSKNGSGVKLLFAPGTYDLFPNENDSHLIELNNANNILIDGNNAEIVVHDPLKGFFSVFRSKNIIIKDLFIDYDPLPFTQGKIVEIDLKNRTFDIKIDEGFPQLNNEMFQKASRVWGMLMDPEIPGKLKDGAPNLYATKDFEVLSPGVFRVKINSINLLKFMEIGDLYVHLARTNGRSLFRSNSSKNITYLNITSYASPAGSYAAFNMEEWNIIGCAVKLKEGRIHSANADCVHANGGAFGPWIENSLFEGYSDDAINLKSTKRQILKQNSPTELIVKYNLIKGDIIRIYNPREGKYLGTFEIINRKPLENNKVLVTLNKPLEETLYVGDTKRHDIAYVDTQSNESFVVRNNTFRNARRYGILLQSSYGIIERNIFKNLSQCAISMNNGVDWGEGFVSHNIKIDRNIFDNCGYDDTYFKDYNAAAIRLRVTKLKNPEAKGKWCGVATAEWQGLENISITNNTFLYNKRALSIECSVDTFIKGNQFIKNVKDLSDENEILLKNNNTNLVFDN
ncbi:right-handed parallel beta-helix repeat-containing protein [Gaetbulibacter saemankumensis]|uniref:right-handed parallel beta-helix repeat-containing protein n=1 Tax=Gaetbulibacter saemankumensis TaxID=311208 RepID=UPI00047F4942|nr:right-handed parallel beta-helix repeat-containing protein [Gaetbulibacter saemankumensis]